MNEIRKKMLVTSVINIVEVSLKYNKNSSPGRIRSRIYMKLA
jgi:hypothetical protein